MSGASRSAPNKGAECRTRAGPPGGESRERRGPKGPGIGPALSRPATGLGRSDPGAGASHGTRPPGARCWPARPGRPRWRLWPCHGRGLHPPRSGAYHGQVGRVRGTCRRWGSPRGGDGRCDAGPSLRLAGHRCLVVLTSPSALGVRLAARLRDRSPPARAVGDSTAVVGTSRPPRRHLGASVSRH